MKFNANVDLTGMKDVVRGLQKITGLSFKGANRGRGRGSFTECYKAYAAQVKKVYAGQCRKVLLIERRRR